MSKRVKLSKGLDINLKGAAEMILAGEITPNEVAIKPTDFPTLVPKMMVKEGETVQIGSPLFFDKNQPEVLFTSPVSGVVKEIQRGEKRRILAVKVTNAKDGAAVDFGKSDTTKLSADETKAKILKSGMWPLIKQRPYDVIANPNSVPKAIFITAFDSAPFGVDYDFVLKEQKEAVKAGMLALKSMCSNIHVGFSQNQGAAEYPIEGANTTIFSGAHPAGNVGVQIHHVSPMNSGETVWCLRLIDIAKIGRLFLDGKIDVSLKIALAGSKVTAPKYYKTIIGTPISEIVSGKITEGGRIISGNPLTGVKVSEENYLGFYDHQVSVIPEGGNEQFLGWIAPGFGKFSLSKTFFAWMSPKKQYDLNTNLNGEERSFVVTGEYEKVFPMEIMPVHLLKAMVVKDIELMEKLGVYEVAPEDFALCEVICTSKIASQAIVREALNFVKEECS